MAAKQFTAEQLKSPYILYVEIVADLPRWGIKAAPFIELKSIPYGRYEVRRPLPLKETGKILSELELFAPPYTAQYTPAEAAEFINLVVANHPLLHAKTTYHDYNKHLVWMREHKAPAAKKPAAKRAPAKAVAGNVQFKIGRTYYQRWYSDWDNSHSDVYMKVVGRTPTMIEAESNTFGNTPSKIVRKKFKIHVEDGVEYIEPQHYAGAKVWKASNIVGGK